MGRIRLILDTTKLNVRRFELGLTVIEVGRRAKLKRSTAYKALRTGICGVKAAGRVAAVLGLDLASLWLDGRTLQPWKGEP